jgi:hypothetical protein
MLTNGGLTLGQDILDSFHREDLKVGSVTASISIDPAWVGPLPPKMLEHLQHIDRRRNLADATGLGRTKMDSTGILWSDCSGYLRVIVSPRLPNRWSVRFRDSCNQRFCPVCSDSRSTKIARKMVDKIRRLMEDKDASLLFITLRGRYCSWYGLPESVDHLHHSVKTLIGDKRFPGTGTSRYTDFTRFDDSTLRPHVHMLVLVGKSYHKNQRRYLRKDEWAGLWEDISRVSEPGAVKVETVKAGDVLGDIFRITKYALTLLDEEWTGEGDGEWSPEEVDRLQKILKGARLHQDYGEMLFRRRRCKKTGLCSRRRRG